MLDFGIAKFVHAGADSTALTATGAVVGTLGYMSPEQVRGGAPHPSWDIWALAVVAYEMLAGRLPFAAATALDSCARGSGGELDSPHRPTTRAPVWSLDSVFEGRSHSIPPSGRLVRSFSLNSFEHVVDGHQ